jgi:hypothetical protein
MEANKFTDSTTRTDCLNPTGRAGRRRADRSAARTVRSGARSRSTTRCGHNLRRLVALSAMASTLVIPPATSALASGSASQDGYEDITELIIASRRDKFTGRISDTPAIVSSNGVSYRVTIVEDYVDDLVQYLDRRWTSWMIENGFEEPTVLTAYLDGSETWRSRCRDSTQQRLVVDGNTDNAFYCPVDAQYVDGSLYRGALIVPLNALQKMWIGDIYGTWTTRSSGDFAAAAIVSHEFAHHVVDELGTQAGIDQPTGKNSELIADCLAGVSAAAIFSDGFLEDGDLDEALAAMEAVGDYDVASSDHHGTPAERSTAFLIGFGGSVANPTPGLPANCFIAYWN